MIARSHVHPILTLGLSAALLVASGCSLKSKPRDETPPFARADKFGVNVDIDSVDALAALTDIKSLGARYVRVKLPFDDRFMPTDRSDPSFARFDRWVKTAAKLELDLVVALVGEPSWLASKPKNRRIEICAQNYLMPLVSRYSGYIDHWELWEFPDRANQALLDGSVGDYMKFLAIVAPIARALDPGAAIIAGAVSDRPARKELSKWDWYAELAKNDIAANVDIIAFHIYPSDAPESILQTAELAEKAKTRVWVTSSGAPGQARHIDHFFDEIDIINSTINPDLIFWDEYLDRRDPKKSRALKTIYDGKTIPSPLYLYLKETMGARR